MANDGLPNSLRLFEDALQEIIELSIQGSADVHVDLVVCSSGSRHGGDPRVESIVVGVGPLGSAHEDRIQVPDAESSSASDARPDVGTRQDDPAL